MLSFAGAEEYLKEQCQEIFDSKKNYDQAKIFAKNVCLRTPCRRCLGVGKVVWQCRHIRIVNDHADTEFVQSVELASAL